VLDLIEFLPAYLGILFETWFGIVGTILTAAEIWRLFGGRMPPRMNPRVMRGLAGFLFFLASAEAYKKAADSKPPASQVLAENPDHARLVSDNNTLREQLDGKGTEIGRLTSALDQERRRADAERDRRAELQRSADRAAAELYVLQDRVGRDEATHVTTLVFTIKNGGHLATVAEIRPYVLVGLASTDMTRVEDLPKQITFAREQQYDITIKKTLSAELDTLVWSGKIDLVVQIEMAYDAYAGKRVKNKYRAKLNPVTKKMELID